MPDAPKVLAPACTTFARYGRTRQGSWHLNKSRVVAVTEIVRAANPYPPDCPGLLRLDSYIPTVDVNKMSISSLFWCLFGLLHVAFANVEKVIFTAPPATVVPQDAAIDSLLMIPLNHEFPSARTYFNASFLTTDGQDGEVSWLLLDNLNPGQRYEVRVCWLATVGFE